MDGEEIKQEELEEEEVDPEQNEDLKYPNLDLKTREMVREKFAIFDKE